MDYNLTDEDVIIDNYKIFIYEDIQIGKYNDHGEYEIVDSYRYNRTDMMIICKKIANHMGGRHIIMVIMLLVIMVYVDLQILFME